MSEKNNLPFSRLNYIIMIVGIVLLIIGFMVMSSDSGGKGLSTAAMTIGPLIVFFGFVIEVVAILYRPKNKE